MRSYLNFGLKLFAYACNRRMLRGSIVHAHRAYFALPFALCKLVTDCKVLVTLHGRTFEVFRDNSSDLLSLLTRPIFSVIELLSLVLVDYVTPVSQDVVNHFRKKYPFYSKRFDRKSKIIPSMIFFPEKQKRNSKIDQKLHRIKKIRKKYICFVGRMAKVKDVPFLIDLVNDYRNFFESNGIYLVMAGSGEEFQNIQQLVKKYDLSHLVIMLGEVHPDAIPSFIKSSKALIICSKHEASPTVLLEAIYAEIPIVSNNVGDVSEIVENVGIGFVVEKNKAAYMNAIVSILDGYKYNIDAKNSILMERSRSAITSIYIQAYLKVLEA